MRIRTRVKIGGALTICVFLAYGAVILHLDRAMSNLAQEVQEANTIVNKIAILRTLTQDFLLYRTERSQRQWGAVYAEVLHLLRNPEYRVLMSEYGIGDPLNKLNMVGDTFSRLMTIQKPASPDKREGGARGELENRLTTQLLLATQDLLTRFLNLTETINRKLIVTQRFISLLDILALSLLGILLISGMIFLQRSVVKPVLLLHAGAEIIGAGNLNHKVGFATPDEIGQLSQAFDRMTANIKEITVSRDELVWEIEERRKAEAALFESEERLRLLGDNLPESAVYQYVHEADGSARFLYFSAGIELLNGISVQNVLDDAGKLHGQIEPEYYERLVEAEARSARGMSDFEMEVPMRRPDGQLRWMQLHSRPRRMADGRTVWDGVQTDITERKRAEEALRESEARFRSLFETMTEGVALHELLYDDQGQAVDYRIVSTNPAFEKHTGLKSAQIQGQLASIAYGTGAPPYLEEYVRVAQTGQAYAFEVFFPPIRRHFHISVTSPKQGQFVTVFEDITARKQAEERLQRTLVELARSNRELEEFAYVASHDLQEPLRKLANFSEMLVNRYQGQLDQRADTYLGYIADGAKRMKDLINDLLAFSRIGRADFSLISADMLDILKGTLNDIQPLVREKQAEITYKSLPVLKVNPPQMGRLLQNLISNAIKFHGDQPARIEVSARQADNQWVIAVRDNGIGFEPQFAEDIFKVFRRLHTKEDYPGTGIGLAICKKIVERHGGRIWAESQPDQGSTFYFTIPA
jgi:PAS domain S-box-containing protein